MGRRQAVTDFLKKQWESLAKWALTLIVSGLSALNVFAVSEYLDIKKQIAASNEKIVKAEIRIDGIKESLDEIKQTNKEQGGKLDKMLFILTTKGGTE